MDNIEHSRDWKDWIAPDTLLPEPSYPCQHWIARTRKAEAEVESLRQQLRGAVDAERERIVALIRREASETFDMKLDHELRVLADRIAAGEQ